MGKKHIAVIGAGILGFAITVELAALGHLVVSFSDDNKNSKATPNSFGWINAHTPEDQHHFQLRLESMRLWRQAKSSYPALPVRTASGIDWDMPQTDIEQTHLTYTKQGHTTQVMDATALEKEFPNLSFPDVKAIISPFDMVAEPNLISGFFSSVAAKMGTKTLDAHQVDAISSTGNRVALSSGSETYLFDHVVIAAGTGSKDLIEPLGYALPMNNRKGVLLRSTPQQKRLEPIISAPDFHFWQLQDGTLLAGSTQACSNPNENLQELKDRLSANITRLIPEFSDVEFPTHTIGTRPEPADGMPVIDMIGERKNIHLAVMHSGITLAPFVAKAIAYQVSTGVKHEKVLPHAIARFQTQREKIAI